MLGLLIRSRVARCFQRGHLEETALVGRIFDICVEKNSELPESDPNRKFKGRVVFEGCHVKDEGNICWAIFSEITSCPATMEAGKAADAFGLLLVVYVDDFKLSGPRANLAQGWSLMASKIKLDPPSSQAISWLRARDILAYCCGSL